MTGNKSNIDNLLKQSVNTNYLLRLFTIILALFVLIGCIGAGYCGYKAYRHLAAQDEKISALQDDVKAFTDIQWIIFT